MPSTVNGTVPRLKNIETLSFSAGRCPEISNPIVMVVARSLVFDMLLSARQAEM
jgi:hypothetical protein